jgi:hypothetical protein
VCKFYQGAEDKEFERQLRVLFKAVHREKPESSRSVSQTALSHAHCSAFIGIQRSLFCSAKEKAQY